MNILKRQQVLALANISQATLSHLLSIANFPKPIMLGGMEVGWREGDVLFWIRALQPESNSFE